MFKDVRSSHKESDLNKATFPCSLFTSVSFSCQPVARSKHNKTRKKFIVDPLLAKNQLNPKALRLISTQENIFVKIFNFNIFSDRKFVSANHIFMGL
jgi:hypothetical protein